MLNLTVRTLLIIPCRWSKLPISHAQRINMNNQPLKFIECPRDAMQGIKTFIPTIEKINYLNQLLKVGFHTLDFGSFVSPKAIPQMADTEEVLAGLGLTDTETRLLAIVANKRGAEAACQHTAIQYLGFPLSLSETFQQRNTNKSISQAFEVVNEVQQLASASDKEQVCYISMGFGNPYGDPFNEKTLLSFVERLANVGVSIVSLSDTIGSANTEQIQHLYSAIADAFPELEIGLHLHSRYDDVYDKTRAALAAGCRRLDGALKGFGGCPMAKDDLVGNMATEEILRAAKDSRVEVGLNEVQFSRSMEKMPLIMR